MQKSVYEVTVDVTVRVKVKTSASTLDESYDNVKTDFVNDPQAFLESYNYEVQEDSYSEVDSEILDEPW